MSAIRWINERLGTGPGEKQTATSPEIGLVDVRDMVDKPGNPAAIVRVKIDEALQHLREGRKVVVCCDYGISRSNAVAAGILAAVENRPLSQAVRQVMEATGETSIKVEVLAAVRKALQEPDASRPTPECRTPRVLVTGGSGFLGGALLPRLVAPMVAFAPSRQEIDLSRGAIELDLYVQEQGINCLVHLANPRIYYTTSALGQALSILRNVLDVCRQHQIRLIYLSGWEVYSGYRAGRLLAGETLPLLPKGVHAETKYLCELLIQHHQREYGLNCLVLRSSPVYGPGSDKPKFLHSFLAKALRGQEIVTHAYANGLPALDLLHVTDIISAIALAVERPVTGSLNLGTGHCTTTAEVARMICDQLGSASRIRQLPVEDTVGNIAMDARLAEATLGWHPTVSLAQGLEQLIQERRDVRPAKIA